MPTEQPEISADGGRIMWLTDFLMTFGPELTMTPENLNGSRQQNYSADPNAHFVWRPHYSPDGKLMIDSLSDDNQFHSTGISLWNPATARRVRQLTTGTRHVPDVVAVGTV